MFYKRKAENALNSTLYLHSFLFQTPTPSFRAGALQTHLVPNSPQANVPGMRSPTFSPGPYRKSTGLHCGWPKLGPTALLSMAAGVSRAGKHLDKISIVT